MTVGSISRKTGERIWLKFTPQFINGINTIPFFIKSTPIKSQTEASTSIIKTDHKMRTETAGMKRNQQRFEIIGHTMLGISPFSRLSRNKDTMKVSVQAQAIMRKVD